MRIKLYKGNYRISSPYGNRRLDNGDNRFHSGIDYVGTDSKEIIAPTNGRIVSSQIITDKNNPTWEWGNYVKMDDLNGFYLFFCHLSSRNVKAGQTVAKGQIIGLEGQTGYSLGSHLHFEVRRKSDGVSINPLDYFEILNEWELNHFKKKVQNKYEFDDSTMEYLAKHPYAVSLFEKLLK
jgi:murein DD-endopeptidase MepM/ murein hydrolase activator NlpD